ncbi:MAG: hypothetical protein ACLGIA_09290 [Actinomycetes bacterium]
MRKAMVRPMVVSSATGAQAVVLVPTEGEADLHEFLRAVGEVARLVA